MKLWQKEFLKVFREYFHAKQLANPKFSIRSIARELNISPGPASALLKGSRVWDFSPSWVLSVVEAMDLKPEVKNKLLVLMDEGARISRKKIDEKAEKSVLTEWYYSAILAAVDLKASERTVPMLSKKLKLSEEQVRKALDFLSEQKLIDLTPDGGFERSKDVLETGDDVPSEQVRKFHIDNLNLCQQAINEVACELREFQTITFAGRKKNLEQVKVELRSFVEKVAVLMADEGESDEIFRFSMQLFPIEFRSGQK